MHNLSEISKVVKNIKKINKNLLYYTALAFILHPINSMTKFDNSDEKNIIM